MYTLVAEAEETTTVVGAYATLEDAAAAINAMEAAGTWPEGHNPVAFLTADPNGQQWLYSDDWEEC